MTGYDRSGYVSTIRDTYSVSRQYSVRAPSSPCIITAINSQMVAAGPRGPWRQSRFGRFLFLILHYSYLYCSLFSGKLTFPPPPDDS